MTTMSQSEPVGNTSTTGTNTKISGNQCYRWAFTLKAELNELGEPMSDQAENIFYHLKPFCKEFYYQLEMGKDKPRNETVNKGRPDEHTITVIEKGYLHYQGCLSLIVKHRLSEVKNILGWREVHLENAINWHALKAYCKKGESRINGPWSHETNWIKTITELRPWQQGIVDIIGGPCVNDRTIYWCWEPVGNIGKTAFTKWCAVHLGASIVRGGALKDIAFSLKENPSIVIFDITRTVESRVNYEALEAVKDGMIFSAKYESKMKIFNSPHVLVLANFPPEMELLSKDRWEIVKL